MSPAFGYEGTELALFAHARNWKAYWSSLLRPSVRGRVLEVGAGWGINIPLLMNEDVDRWISLEPDPELARRIGGIAGEGGLDVPIEVLEGTTEDLEPTRDRFDTIVYIDVLEHIVDDRGELKRAAGLLEPGGHLLVLAPAHQKLYSNFDRSIGHHRRYDRDSLLAAAPADLSSRRVFYADSAGVMASLLNRLILRQSSPTHAQIRMWDRYLVPLSRWIDPLLGWRFGKTVIGIWQKPFGDAKADD